MKNNKLWRVRLTNRCCAKCLFCHNEGFKILPNSLARDISSSFVQHLLESKVDINDSVALSGGEPLLHPDLGNLLRWTVNKVNDKCHLNTNGILLKDKLNYLFDTGLKNIHVNLATLNKDIYKVLYRVEFPSFLWNTLEKAVKLGMHININIVVLKGYNESDFFANDFIKRCEMSCFDVTFIEPYEPSNLKSKGILFQENYGRLLLANGFNLLKTIPGRKIYKKERCHVRIASPCAPAMAWNGSPEDDAFIVLETEEIRKFSTGEIIENGITSE